MSPSAASAHETVRTLKFTIGVKGISNHPTVLLNPQACTAPPDACAAGGQARPPWTQYDEWLGLHGYVRVQDLIIKGLQEEVVRLR